MLTDEQLRERIASRLSELNRSPITAANKGGLERSYIRDFLESKKESIKSRFYGGVAAGLDWTVEDLLKEGTAQRPNPPEPNLPGAMASDVPVKGSAAGGNSADFFLNGQTIDYVRRPPGVAKMTGVFALFVTGDSMSPRFEEGELIYVSSVRSPSIGDYVVIELHPMRDGDDTPGFVKKLEKRTATKIVCSQFNPIKTIDFEMRRVKALHRVIPWNELLSV